MFPATPVTIVSGVITLHAGDGNELGFLDEYFVVDTGPAGREFTRVLERTGQFAGLAADTFSCFDTNQLLHE